MAEQASLSRLSIIVPTYNEEKLIQQTLTAIKASAPTAELLVVDGGSTDKTISRASRITRVISTSRGRGIQMNAGVLASSGEMLLFLHADTLPDATGIQELLATMKEPHLVGGAFRLRFDDPRPAYKRVARAITRRSLKTLSYTGDQGIFVRRSTFKQLGGYHDWPFMEDVDFSERMGRAGLVVLLEHKVETSARRHQRWGLFRTQLTVVLIRLFYLLKLPPASYEWLWPPIR